MRKFLMVLGLGAVLGSISTVSYAQGTSMKELPKGWHMLDKEKDGVYGISIDKAYDFVKGKKSKTIIVAVIDSGIDTLHEDLKEVLWVNPKEIPGNGIDDDKNGYIDDVHGWNFLGGKDGTNVKEDSFEGARVYHSLKKKFEGRVIDPAKLEGEEKEEYTLWLKAKEKIEEGAGGGGADFIFLKKAYEECKKSNEVLKRAMIKDTFTGKDLEMFAPLTSEVTKARSILLYMMKGNNSLEETNVAFMEGFGEYMASEEKKKEALDKAPKDYRGEIVKDNENDINDKFYGNNDVMANTPMHGTHVSGIIAAKRKNGKGMDGIADNVRIMAIRAVPDGDEHDKDIALAIRYAVDNGAKVVNMSFGKGFSPQKKWVDEAVKYAESKGVILVHAAGNDAANVDTTENYPNPAYFSNSGRASNWISVGASSDPMAEGFKSYTASFSNYGQKEVDVFAPGTRIYSTVPGGNTYQNLQGTSMASPVVAGVAAFILSYYPELTPQQVKYAIEKSATPLPFKVKKPGTDEMVDMSELSRSGGVLNAYEAVKIASTLVPGKKDEKLPASTLKNKKG